MFRFDILETKYGGAISNTKVKTRIVENIYDMFTCPLAWLA